MAGADGCPEGMYRRIGSNDPRYPCERDPNYRAPQPAQVFFQAPVLGWCAPGYYRPPSVGNNSPCVVDPNWRPATGSEGEYVNVGGTLIRRSELGVPSAPYATSAGAPSGDLLAGLGLDSTTLVLIGAGLLVLVMMSGGRKR